MSIILGILTVILILVALFLILVVLMQPAKSDGGMGAAMGGGMAESAFGGETSNVLTRATIKAAIAFFVLSFLLFLGNVYQRQRATDTGGALPNIPVPATAPSSTAPAPTGNQAEVLKQLQQQMAKQPAPAPAAGSPATPAPTTSAPPPAAPAKAP